MQADEKVYTTRKHDVQYLLAREEMMITKQNLLACLPIRDDDLTIRAWRGDDVDRRAAWPPYPPPCSDFTTNLSRMSEADRDSYFRTRDEDQSRITLIGDFPTDACVAHIGVCDADWHSGTMGNMGFRVHPDWCNKGVGSRVLELVVAHFAGVGITCFRLDVAESNSRAIRCYEKVGFVVTEDFDRDGILFYWMELNVNERPTTASPGADRAGDA